MRCARAIAALVAVLAVASRGEATITLELRVDAEVHADVTVHVAVRNVGEEDALDVLPHLTLAGASATGDAPTPLASGFVASWDVHLPRPRTLGTLPLVVQLRYADGLGHRMSAPAVHVVRTAGTPAADVAVAVDAAFGTIDRGSGTVRITNREADTVTGTLALVANEEVDLVPAERTVEVAPGATVAVPIEIRNHDALPDSAIALWASLQLARGAAVETVLGSAIVRVQVAAPPAEPPWLLLALLGLGALALVAWGLRRFASADDSARTRAERRRARRTP